MWDPYRHAAAERLLVIHASITETGLYSARHRTILLRTGMPAILDRCTLAHELGHHHYRHTASTPTHERLADAWAAQHLIDLHDLVTCATTFPENPERWCGELAVTPHMLRVWISTPSNYQEADRLIRAAA